MANAPHLDIELFTSTVAFSKAPSTTNTPCSVLSVLCFPSMPHTTLPCHHPQHCCLSTQTNTTYHQSNHFIKANTIAKCQHTAQVKCCQTCIHDGIVCDVLDTFTSNLIPCGQSNIVPFMTSITHDARFCCGVETSQVKTIQLSVPHQSLAQQCHLFLVHWFVCYHMCPFITTQAARNNDRTSTNWNSSLPHMTCFSSVPQQSNPCTPLPSGILFLSTHHIHILAFTLTAF